MGYPSAYFASNDVLLHSTVRYQKPMRIRNDVNLTMQLRNISMAVEGNEYQTNKYKTILDTYFVETTAPFDLMTSAVDMVMISSKTYWLTD